MFSSLLFLAEDIVIDGTLEDGNDPVSEFNDQYDRVTNTVDFMFVIIPVAMVLMIGFGIFVAVRNYRAAKRQGMDPFAVETELAGRVYVADLDHPGKGRIIFHGRGKLTGITYVRGAVSAPA